MKTVSIKPCINRENRSRISKFSYTVIVLTRTTKFLEVVIPPDNYQTVIYLFTAIIPLLQMIFAVKWYTFLW